MIKPFHSGQAFANQSLAWWSPDTQSRFKELIQEPEFQQYFESRQWHHPGVISYDFNSEGFRSPEFNTASNTVLALGCSYTMGIGLPVSDTWPYMLAQALNMQYANLGWGGASGDYCYRMAEYWIPTLKPKLVVLLNPPESRMEIVIDADGRCDDVSAMTIDQSRWAKDQWLQDYYGNDENLQLHQRKNSNAIGGICHKHHIYFLSYTAHDWMARSREELGYARDRYHAGRPGHQQLVEQILDDWNKLTQS